VRMALDGPSGLESAKKDRPSLVILDLMLPGMGGKDICRALKSNPLTQLIPILMLTARSGEEDKQRGMEAGANLYLPKPISPKRLIALVEEALK